MVVCGVVVCDAAGATGDAHEAFGTGIPLAVEPRALEDVTVRRLQLIELGLGLELGLCG